MEQEQILMRKERGKQIAKTCQITRLHDGWIVPSQTGGGYYFVKREGFKDTCTCPDHETRHCKCKHIWAVEMIITKEIDKEGNITVTKTVRKTYSQKWSEYDQSQIHQKELFMKLLSDLTNNVEQPQYTFGRPTIPLSDMIYNSVLKVFTTFSLRRFMSDMQIAQEKGYVENKPCYASIGHFLQKEELTPILSNLIALTSLPLTSIENNFAIDSTGFGTSRFDRWYSFKYGKEIKSRKWVKCHFMTGVKTNIVTSVKLTTEYEADSPQLKELIQKSNEHFDMKEISADKAYLSRENLTAISEVGATPYIPFKINTKGRSKGFPVWNKMYHYFMLHHDEFIEHYHKRSNVETTVFMIKSKFGDYVRSKDWTAQVNEVLCKIICHNICVVIQEMHESGINPLFCVESKTSVYKESDY